MSRATPSRRAAAITSTAVALAALASLANPAAATTKLWAGSSGGTFASGPWNPSGVPLPGDAAVVNITNPAPYTINYNANYGPGTNALTSVLWTTTNTVSSVITPPLVVTQSTGSFINLYAGAEAIGASATSNVTFAQSAATHAISGTLTIATIAGGTGAYSLSGASSLLSAGAEQIGVDGVGSFSQLGGTHHVSGALTLGADPAGVGYYSLSGGTLSPSSTVIGSSGIGSFTQTGGTHAPTGGNLELGLVAKSTGTYSLSGSGALIATNLTVGDDGTGLFIQSGTTASTNSLTTLTLGLNSNSTGTYSLSGSASLATTIANVGLAGRGTFVQTGGTHQTAFLNVGAGPGTGTYSLSGTGTLDGGMSGQLSIGAGGSGAHGSFIQTGGSVTNFNSFQLGTAHDTGYYSLSGTGSLVSLLENYDGNSTFVQSGGTHSVTANTFLGLSAASAPSYTLSGGSATIPDLRLAYADSSSASFQHTGGSAHFSTLYLGYGASTTASYSLSSTASLTTDTLIVGFGAPATFTQSGGAHTNSFLYLESGSYALSAGSLSSTNASVGGGPASATFAQSGGTHTAASLTISSSPATTASYNLTGGTLSATNVRLGFGGVGTLSVSGSGSATVTGTLQVDSSPLGNSLNLSGGTLSLAGTLDLQSHPENFHWTGGTLNFSSGYTINSSFPLGPTLTVPAGATLAAAAPSTNTGTLLLATGASLAGPGTLTNAGALSLTSANISAPLVNAPAGLLFGSGSVSGPFTNNGSLLLSPGNTLKLTGPTATSAGAITLNGGTLDSANHPFTNTGVLSGHGALSNMPTLVNNGSVAVLGGPLTFAGSLTGSGSLYVDPASSLSAPGGLSQSQATLRGPTTISAPSSLTTLTLDAPTGSLDLTTASLTTNTPASILRSYLLSHQLFSSLSDSTHTLGYIPTPSGLLVQLALLGDANLDGTLNADDYALLDRSLAVARTNALWTDGDFNYDGIINNQDYLLIDSTYLQVHPSAATTLLAQRDAQFGPAYVSALLTSVPEPSVYWLLTAGYCLLPLPRRRT